MGDYYFDKSQDRQNATAAVTGGGPVIATINGVAGYRWTPVGIQCSGDLGALVTIEDEAGVLWRKRMTSAFAFSDGFLLGAIKAAAGKNLLVKISASTLVAEVNMQALHLPA